MDAERRISQFEELCKDDPNNDMAFFSLGGAYAQAERHDEAAGAYLKCIEINDQMSKAYQLGAKALVAAGRQGDAVELLQRGYLVADARGDMLPRDGMADLLKELGADVPAGAGPAAEEEAAETGFTCSVTGKPGHPMERPPFRGPVGEWIQRHVARETFDQWIGLGTKIINELKLDLSRDEHDAAYDYAMRRYLRLDDATYAEITGGVEPPHPPAEYREALDMILGRSGDIEDFQGSMDQRLGS